MTPSLGPKLTKSDEGFLFGSLAAVVIRVLAVIGTEVEQFDLEAHHLTGRGGPGRRGIVHRRHVLDMAIQKNDIGGMIMAKLNAGVLIGRRIAVVVLLEGWVGRIVPVIDAAGVREAHGL